MCKLPRIAVAVLVASLAPRAALAATAVTQVRLATSFGNINVQLLPQSAPKTVANFLSYVNSGAYDVSFFHRSVAGFVVQGGGYDIANNQITQIPSAAPVAGEGGVSNLRGTIAVALSSGPNSGTNQFFFNLVDNSQQLDGTAAGGPFTVFARVSDDASLAVMDNIAAAGVVHAAVPFDSLPVVNFSGNTVQVQNLIYVNSVDDVLPAGSADFLASASPTQVNVAAGATGTATVTVTPIAGYQGTVTPACGVLPLGTSCAFAPASLTFAAGATAAQTSTLSITTTKTLVAAANIPGPAAGTLAGLGAGGGLAGLAGFFGFACVAVVLLARPKHSRMALLGAGFLAAAAGCGGSSTSTPTTPKATPAGTYSVAVRLSDGTVSHPSNLALVVQ
jgi:cyclophilin family peptidyl-prolyl cis-trans isomerase